MPAVTVTVLAATGDQVNISNKNCTEQKVFGQNFKCILFVGKWAMSVNS